MPIRTKSVHSPIDRRRDGLRILATRYRGHGLPTSRYDVWMASLGPSEKLVKAFLGGKITPARFRTLYRREMLGTGETDPANPFVANRGQKFTLRLLRRLARDRTVTIMCHCAEDQKNCHRFVLQDLIRKA